MISRASLFSAAIVFLVIGSTTGAIVLCTIGILPAEIVCLQLAIIIGICLTVVSTARAYRFKNPQPERQPVMRTPDAYGQSNANIESSRLRARVNYPALR